MNIHLVEITQEETAIIQHLNIILVVAVFAPLGKTLLQFGLSSTVTPFFPLIDVTGFNRRLHSHQLFYAWRDIKIIRAYIITPATAKLSIAE